ncbi:MAG: hypothetical protein ACJAZO_003896 [Myxococcota bacterium]|jgi:hypothetical protein
MTGPKQIRLTGRAARLIQMLTDFGHMDAGAADSVLVELANQYGTEGSATLIDLAQVRRVVAALLSDHPAMDGGNLHEDWGPLFY